jgi:hypothetical protein
MMLVAAIIAMIAGISFPAVSAGLETIRLNSASESLATFLNAALNRAERRQEPMEIVLSLAENSVSMRDAAGRFTRRMDMTKGVIIRDIQPGTPELNQQPRSFVVLPGGVAPAIAVELGNSRGGRRLVRVDPITGTPEVRPVP